MVIHGKLGKYTIDDTEGIYSISIQTEKAKNRKLTGRDPWREAERLMAGFRLRPGLLGVVLGLGHYPLLQSLTDSGRGRIMVIERDENLAAGLLQREDFAALPIEVVTGNTSVSISDFAESLQIEDLLGYRIIRVPACTALDEEFYRDAEFRTKNALASRLSDLFTRLEFEPRWIFNSLSTLRYGDTWLPVKTLFGCAAGGTAVLVSSGPSLRHSLDSLRALQDSVCICAVDGAYRILHRAGIRPNLIYTLDSQPYTIRHWLGLPSGKPGEFPFMVADAVANPMVVRHWTGTVFTAITAQYFGESRHITPGCEVIEEVCGAPGDVQSGGSVATSAFDLLRQMGFARIILIGQDLAYTGREIHCTGTHHYDTWFSQSTRIKSVEGINDSVVRKRHTTPVKGIRGIEVPADYILGLYHRWFEDAATRVPAKLLNATYDGLTIRGFDPVPPEVISQEPDTAILEAIRQRAADRITLIPDPATRDRRDKLFQAISKAGKTAADPDHFRFLERIGRKFTIQARRRALEGSKDDNSVISDANLRDMRFAFLRMLQRKFT